jgi:LmbE family N-acetylglucosaminyl deacetylase
VVTHAYEGGHPDHDAISFAVQSACRIGELSGLPIPERVEMSSYFGRDGVRVTSSFLNPFPPSRTVALDSDSRALKDRMLACHSSQAELLKILRVDVECFRCAPVYDFRKPPHQGRLFYEYHELNMDGARWRQLAVRALVELGLAS